MRRSSVLKVLVGCAAALLFFGCVSTPNHPNLVAAQQLCQQAIDKITAAQQANNFDMKGHAAKAKQLLQQAMNEIQLAERAADNR
ncbi:MAG TPA: hypothetical protein VFI08_04505 [Spirochaetia bacterium]|nr:hypothetical protein [Spirochaetia bacterium]